MQNTPIQCHKVPPNLRLWQYEIERIGRKLGLNCCPNVIVVADHEEISELAAYSGYPVRFHHWKFGQESLRLKKSYRWGMHIIYEMVIPSIPCFSYLLDANPETVQKAVIAHACVGHNDFFRNNVWFRDIPTNLHHKFGDNAQLVEDLRLEVGKEKVDNLLEACMSLDNLFNLLEPIIVTPTKTDKDKQREKRLPKRIKTRDELPYYMEPWINPPEFLEKERIKIEREEQRKVDVERKVILPAEPTRDILQFVLQETPLEKWQQEIIRIVREEALFLLKGAQTKIMNEGWAAFWETQIMLGEGVALDSEICSFAKTYAGVQRGNRFQINPYKLGKQLWDSIKFRWNTGRHGEIWNDCKEKIIRDRWEEFIVFKSLFDETDGNMEDLAKLWAEFTTLVHETREGHGFIKEIFFLPEEWILEWLKYREAEQKLPQLEDGLEYIKKREAQFKTKQSEIARFAMRHKIMMRSLSPFAAWSSEELQQEMAHYQFYAKFRKKIERGEVALHKVEIPEEWVRWAKQKKFIGHLGQGLEKMFEVRTDYSDVNFISDFFTQDFCDAYHYYTFGIGKPGGNFWGEDRVIVKSRNYLRVKKLLLDGCLNLGQPKIVLLNANFHNNSEWRLIHLHDGKDLCYDGCQDCNHSAPGVQEILERLFRILGKGKPVHLETINTIWPTQKPSWFYWMPPGTDAGVEIEKPEYNWVRYSFDGKKHATDVLEFSHIPDLRTIKKLLPWIPPDM